MFLYSESCIDLLFTIHISTDKLADECIEESTQFRWICLFILDSTQEIYIPNDSQESSLQTYTHILV